ncbi:MAG TPA: FAD-binding and (Fe-S)-binding domain-containing protein [Bacteroidales bacterium]|nr:FAD-binding and (Fe-S)-binding domain-containing protein [Bacteroidales bacterium]
MNFNGLKLNFKGELQLDGTFKKIYATDASAYRQYPVMVAFPACNEDISKLIQYATANKLTLVPRGAGTSLAGQVVAEANGVVVDISRHLNNITEVNVQEKWAWVQPGVVLDELNLAMQAHGLFFGPETSTSNRCTIGGMMGNNACGAHSLLYGSTRDHLLEMKGFLSDGSFVHVKPLNKQEFLEKMKLNTLEGAVYKHIFKLLSNTHTQKSIQEGYPHPLLKRRNTGYAVDLLLDNEVFGHSQELFNFCKLLAGSEGTLFFATDLKINLLELPPKHKGLLCAHFHSLDEAVEANLLALKHQPASIELIDDIIINCTKDSIGQKPNRFFIEGNPGAILIIEFYAESEVVLQQMQRNLEADLRQNNLGFHFPFVTGADMSKVWAMRKAALGLLSNIVGDAKPVSLVEDTAVFPELLKDYLHEFKAMLAKYHLTCVFHGHISTGELHLRPVINVKTPEGLQLFRKVASETADLVKKYRGSLSGEHGDGRLRGEFISKIIGKDNFDLCCQIKQAWDPRGIFNAGKITATPPMDTNLRYVVNPQFDNIPTYFSFDDSAGYYRHIERCNGSADCRKGQLMGGTMCPTFMATGDELMSTRARANMLREAFQNFDGIWNTQKDTLEVLDNCLSCKACKKECPSNVDMTKLKAEYLQHHYDAHGVPLKSRMIASLPVLFKLSSLSPAFFNFISQSFVGHRLLKPLLGFSNQRSIPVVYRFTLTNWIDKQKKAEAKNIKGKNKIWLWADEFTNYLDVEVGMKAYKLLSLLGYDVHLLPMVASSRTYLSKGMVKKAKAIVNKNLAWFERHYDGMPIVGIEPSAILTLRDEYLDLADACYKSIAQKVAQHSMPVEEFICNLYQARPEISSLFQDKEIHIALHGHCYQKVLSDTSMVKKMLEIPANSKVTELKTGCCGMAGAFGYEKRHYQLSMQIGELSLFPSVRKLSSDTIVAASGTSCRQQILDGTGKKAFHPVEILYNLLTNSHL